MAVFFSPFFAPYVHCGGRLCCGHKRVVSVGSRQSRTVAPENRIITENHHEAIVSEEEFLAAQQVISNVTESVAYDKDEYPLRGMVFCANCQLAMFHEKRNGTLKCKHKREVGNSSTCSTHEYDGQYIQSIVWEALIKHIHTLKVLKLLSEQKEVEIKQFQKRAKSIELQVEELKTLRIQLYESYASGLISVDQYRLKKQKINDQIQALTENLNEIPKVSEEQLKTREKLGAAIEMADSFGGTPMQKRKIAENFIEKVVIYDATHIEVSFKFEDLLSKASNELNAM